MFSSSSRGQIKLIFPLMAALLIIVVLMFVGFKGVDDVLKDKDLIDMIQFGDTVQTSLQRNNDYGSVTQEQFVLPGTYHTMCFISAQSIVSLRDVDDSSTVQLKFIDGSDLLISLSVMDVLKRSLENGVSTNIFLISDSIVYPLGYSPYVVLKKESSGDLESALSVGEIPILCQQSYTGRVSLRMEGLGRTTLVSFPLSKSFSSTEV